MWTVEWDWNENGVQGQSQCECQRPSEMWYCIAALKTMIGVDKDNVFVYTPSGAKHKIDLSSVDPVVVS